MYRYKRSINVSRERQGYIYCTSRMYERLTPEQRHTIRELCRQCGGEYWRALLDFVTTDDGATAVCSKYPVSRSTLYRIVRRYYQNFPKIL